MKTIDFYYAARGESKDADMARVLGITTSAIAQAKKREHLSAYHAANVLLWQVSALNRR